MAPREETKGTESPHGHSMYVSWQTHNHSNGTRRTAQIIDLLVREEISEDEQM